MRDVRASFAASALMIALMAPGRAEAQAVAFTPGVGTIPDGVSMSVTPAVSADRRYVRLSLGVGFQTVDGFQNIPFGGAAVGGAGGGGAGAGGRRGFLNVMEGFDDVLGIPYALDDTPGPSSTRATKPLRAGPTRSRKPLPDPVIVPIKKAVARAAVAPRN